MTVTQRDSLPTHTYPGKGSLLDSSLTLAFALFSREICKDIYPLACTSLHWVHWARSWYNGPKSHEEQGGTQARLLYQKPGSPHGWAGFTRTPPPVSWVETGAVIYPTEGAGSPLHPLASITIKGNTGSNSRCVSATVLCTISWCWLWLLFSTKMWL